MISKEYKKNFINNMHILSKLVKIKICYCQKNILLIGYNKNLRKLLIKSTFSIVDMATIMETGPLKH
jgi:hypothetical protein